jgi:uncharacterized protein YodC (DUF2158 family)
MCVCLSIRNVSADHEHRQDDEEMMQPKFSPGDKVRCKVGGPLLVVGYAHVPHQVGVGVGLNMFNPPAPNLNPQASYTCYWWNAGANNFQQFMLPENALEEENGDD